MFLLALVQRLAADIDSEMKYVITDILWLFTIIFYISVSFQY